AGGWGGGPAWAPWARSSCRRRRRDRLGAHRGVGHDLFLRRVGAAELAADAALAHHDDPVAHAEDLRELRRDHDDPLALSRELVEQVVDLALRAHVDAPRGLVEDEDVGVRREPLGHGYLLLVSAGEAATLLP